MATINLPFSASGPRRIPTADELATGYECGPLDEGLDNWLEWFSTGQIGRAISEAGLTVDDAELARLAQAIQSGKISYAVATGTENAWIVAPSLAVPAYAAGRVLWIKAPATNTSTIVNMNVSTLGNRRVKKADGTDPSVGDLLAGVWYPTIDDGTNICIVKNLASDINAAIRSTPVFGLYAAPAASFNVPDNTITQITSFGTVVNNLPGTTFSGGNLTIGLAGYYLISAFLGGNYATQAGSYSWVSSINVAAVSKIGTSGVSTNTSALGLGTFFSGAGVLPLAAGNVLTLTQKHNSGVTQNAPMGLAAIFLGK